MKIKLFQPLYVNAALAFAFLFVSYSVLAQDVSEAAYQPNATTALEEIIVTARKREESLQDAPVAITAFGQQMIEDYQINTFDDLAAMMPSLISSDGTSGPSGGAIFLRGITVYFRQYTALYRLHFFGARTEKGDFRFSLHTGSQGTGLTFERGYGGQARNQLRQRGSSTVKAKHFHG